MSEQEEQAETVSGEESSIDPSIQNLIQDGRNKLAVRCQRCPSLMLNPFQAKFVKKEIFLPHMKKKSEDQKPEDGETYSSHWLVDNMYKFENIGFSNTVGTIKYLICADCEVGPVGYQDMRDKNSIYLAIDRVKHFEK